MESTHELPEAVACVAVKRPSPEMFQEDRRQKEIGQGANMTQISNKAESEDYLLIGGDMKAEVDGAEADRSGTLGPHGNEPWRCGTDLDHHSDTRPL